MSASTEPRRFADHVVVVTGAGQGIGRATALRFAREGADVGVLDTNLTNAEAVATEVAELGPRSLALGCDVSSRTEVEEAFERIGDEFDSVHVLVNNAGVVRNNLIHKLTDDDWNTVININLRGSFLCAQAAQRFMIEQRYGKIINLSSQAAVGTERGFVNYSASKAGVQGMTRALALDLGRFEINVNAVAPGHVETPAQHDWAAGAGISYDEMRETFASRNALPRVGQPSDIAGVIAFLASEDARHMTGQVLYVTGRPNVG